MTIHTDGRAFSIGVMHVNEIFVCSCSLLSGFNFFIFYWQYYYHERTEGIIRSLAELFSSVIAYGSSSTRISF